MCEPTSMMILSAASGVMSGYGAIQSGKAGAAAAARESAELEKQMRIAEVQSVQEETARRDAARYAASANLTAAAGSGFMSSSRSFENIYAQNEKDKLRDLANIRANKDIAQGQRATQQYEFDVAGHAAKQQGLLGAFGAVSDGILSAYDNMPAQEPKAKVIGVSNNSISGPKKTSLRPLMRPA